MVSEVRSQSANLNHLKEHRHHLIGRDNDIILCDGSRCGRAYHQHCVDPPVPHSLVEEKENAEEGEEESWWCPACTCKVLACKIFEACISKELAGKISEAWRVLTCKILGACKVKIAPRRTPVTHAGAFDFAQAHPENVHSCVELGNYFIRLLVNLDLNELAGTYSCECGALPSCAYSE
eukprot:1139743-Pelagomonas_calceolata.AAC.7